MPSLHWKPWPSWFRCLANVTALWLVLHEEGPLHPSVSLFEAGGRLLLAGLLWTTLSLCVSLLYIFCHYRETNRQKKSVSQISEVALRGTGQDQQACQQDAGQLVIMINALLDGLVASFLHEGLRDSSFPQIYNLLTRLEAVSQTINKGDLTGEGYLQASYDSKGSQDESSIKGRVKHICTYLQDRVSALRSLLQVQDQYGVCVANVLKGLQEHWELLERMHTRVTLQPKKCQGPEDPHTVLSDTESLYTQLGLFNRNVDECQTHLTTSTQLIQKLESRQQALAESVGLTVESTWTKDLLQCNTQQFEKVHEDFMSLEQQTQTFITHLRGLRLSKEGSYMHSSGIDHVQSNPSSPVSAVPVYSTTFTTASPDMDPDPQIQPKPSSKLSVLHYLCGVRRRK